MAMYIEAEQAVALCFALGDSKWDGTDFLTFKAIDDFVLNLTAALGREGKSLFAQTSGDEFEDFLEKDKNVFKKENVKGAWGIRMLKGITKEELTTRFMAMIPFDVLHTAETLNVSVEKKKVSEKKERVWPRNPAKFEVVQYRPKRLEGETFRAVFVAEVERGVLLREAEENVGRGVAVVQKDEVVVPEEIKEVASPFCIPGFFVDDTGTRHRLSDVCSYQDMPLTIETAGLIRFPSVSIECFSVCKETGRHIIATITGISAKEMDSEMIRLFSHKID